MQSRLTESQRTAVEHFEGPLLVLAGPGSGKTRVITQRIARLIERGVSPRNILGLTFTNKAAEEMVHRVESLVPGSRVWVSTFHRFCARLLREYAEQVGLQSNFSIFDTDDQRGLIKRVLSGLNLDSAQYAPARIGSAISRMKNDLVTLNQVVQTQQEAAFDFQSVVVAKVLPEYQKLLRESNAVDFDDLMLHVVSLLRDNPDLRSELDQQYRFILVDEYQDTNLAQYELIRGLAHDVPNLCATGDPDQSIYGWRGARIDNILRFESDYPDAEVVRLEDNFRSTKSILRAADSLIEHNIHRKAKRLRTHNEAGDDIKLHRFWNGQQEADKLALQIKADVEAGVWNWSDVAIFYRVNWLSREVEMALSRHQVPYQVAAGLAFYDRAEVKDMLAYLRAIENPADRAAMSRVINNPPRGIGKSSLEKLTRFADKHELTLPEAASHAREIPELSAAPTKALLAFAELMHGLRDKAAGPVAILLRAILAETGYGKEWDASDDEQEQQRLGNVTELILAAQQYDETAGEEGSLQAFLETTALVSDSDAIDRDAGAVTLMTLHAAKGLEFPVVFILGFEQNLIPHERAVNDQDDYRRALSALEEERRLLFVGITRAMKQLHLTQCVERYSFGRPLHTLPSQFQTEIEFETVDHTSESPFEIKFGKRKKPSYDEDSQEVPDDFLDFDFGASGPSEQIREQSFGDRPVKYEVNIDDADVLAEPVIESVVKSFDEPVVSKSPTRSFPDLKSKLTTGAALLQSRTAESAPLFAIGNTVRHPRYGIGKVIEVGQIMRRQSVTVEFPQDARRETFVAEKCPLTQVGLR
ncbi:MAG: UvrD-helicase domain-containing protein [Planctomycetia bacterium]|nr:UvrD-helicase domain-containing protein [Planctomycetia bacterium]